MVMVFPPCLRRSRSNDNAQDRPATAISQGAYACPEDRELDALETVRTASKCDFLSSPNNGRRPAAPACLKSQTIHFTRSAHRRGRSSFSHREEGADLGRRRLNLDYNRVFDGLQSVEDTFGVPANIARSHDEFLRADSRFHFALHNVRNRFVRVSVKRGADSRRIMDLEECHLVTLDKRLDEHIAAIQRLALDGAYRHSLDVSISRFDHTGLP